MPKKAIALSSLAVENIPLSEPKSNLTAFKDFCSIKIASAITELQNIKEESNRIHLQKLVYTNIIDRFDQLIDRLLLWSAVNNPTLRSTVLASLKDEPINKKEVYELFLMGEKSLEHISGNIRIFSREIILRRRHAQKLRQLMDSVSWQKADAFRVNNSNGHIMNTCKRHPNIPNAIIGFADWLYCRRNSIVHLDGVHYTENDYKSLRESYKVSLSTKIKISLPSLSNAVNFYLGFVKEFDSYLEKI